MPCNPIPLAALLVMLGACAAERSGPPPFALEVEGGAAWQMRNDVAVPGDSGTRFALDSLTGSGPFPVGRLYATWSPTPRQEVRGLIAPLRVSGEGQFAQPVSFAGQTFAAGVPTDANYRFDSYRLTWRYLVHDGARWDWRLGLTAKLRDAEIELQQAGLVARKTDLGLVPLLHVAADWQLARDWRLALDVDGAVASQGRAIDASLKGYWTLREGLELGMGYRALEGGADNDEVYTFAWFQQAVLSLRWTF